MFKLKDGKSIELGMWISDGDCCYEVQEMSEEYVVVREVDLDSEGAEPCKLCNFNLLFLNCNDIERMKEI